MSADQDTPTTTTYYVLGGAWEAAGSGSAAVFVHPVSGESLTIDDEYDDTEMWPAAQVAALLADLVPATDTVYVAATPEQDYQGRPMWATARKVTITPHPHKAYDADNCPRCGTAQRRMGQMS